MLLTQVWCVNFQCKQPEIWPFSGGRPLGSSHTLDVKNVCIKRCDTVREVALSAEAAEDYHLILLLPPTPTPQLHRAFVVEFHCLAVGWIFTVFGSLSIFTLCHFQPQQAAFHHWTPHWGTVHNVFTTSACFPACYQINWL